MEFPEPTSAQPDRSAVLRGYLDYFRSVAIAKVEPMAPVDQRRSRLPSGWSPIELLNHLRHVERRWLEWGFEGSVVDDPWADHRDDRWWVDPSVTVDGVIDDLRRQGRVTAQVLADHGLDELGRPGPRWDGADPPTLERICLHLVQEYARHVGHLDIVWELVDGTTGE